MPQKNMAFEMLKKLLNDEIKIRQRKNFIQLKSFAEMLDKSIKAYMDKSIEAAEVIEHLIELARKMRDEQQKATDTVLEQAKLLCKDWAEKDRKIAL